ncbi:MAG: hypothetical protein KJ645_03400 [Planctomycetes bacterium]|nr:hypothetical protein [Planctomycetota bacterium]
MIGNHEGENGWYYHSENEDYRNLAIFSTRARKETIPNPQPDGFYSGNTDVIPEFGLREDYFSWEWGDALFVVLSPFWYTTRCPHEPISGAHHPCSYDGWDWTLGKKQYDWLYDTLDRSRARWKFVFIHHLTSTSTVDYDNSFYGYGRGGGEIAKYKVDKRASFEWGGENEKGENIFLWMRDGWSHGPVHDLLVSQKVHIVFHGHDHLYAMQKLDDIVYQECPQPINSKNNGYQYEGWYKQGGIYPNSGHLQVTVGPKEVKVEYVRSFLPGEGTNKKVAFAYLVK